MTKIKTQTYTPGPWTLDIGTTYIAVHGADKQTVHVDMYPERARELGEANARLIAAAPTMKDALDLEAAWLESVLRVHDGGPFGPQLLRVAFEHRLIAIRAAIAKATGENK